MRTMTNWILLGLNVCALLAFFLLFALVYATRASWAHAVMVREVALNGLPVDEKDVDHKGRPKSDNLTTQLLKETGGDPQIKTQKQGVEDLKKKLQATIDDDSAQVPDPKNPTQMRSATKAQKQALVLLRVAMTLDERLRLLEVWHYEEDAERAKNMPEPERKRIEEFRESLEGSITAAFSDSQLTGKPGAAKEGEEASGSKPLEGLERGHKRQAIAFLMVNLHDVFSQYDPAADPFESATYKRVLGVCGARAVAEALSKRAQQLERLQVQLSELVNQERIIFADEHQYLLSQVLDRYTESARHDRSLEQVKKQVAAQEKHLDDQKKAYAKARGELEKAQTETDSEMKRVDKLQQDLYEVRLRLRDANRINQDLEAEIRLLEKKIGPTRPTRPVEIEKP